MWVATTQQYVGCIAVIFNVILCYIDGSIRVKNILAITYVISYVYLSSSINVHQRKDIQNYKMYKAETTRKCHIKTYAIFNSWILFNGCTLIGHRGKCITGNATACYTNVNNTRTYIFVTFNRLIGAIFGRHSTSYIQLNSNITLISSMYLDISHIELSQQSIQWKVDWHSVIHSLL